MFSHLRTPPLFVKVNITCVDSVSQALTLAQTAGSAVISTYSVSEYSAPRDTQTSLKDVVWSFGVHMYYHNVKPFYSKTP